MKGKFKMNRRKKITPQVEERARKFHELWEKGFTVKEAAEKIGICWGSIYDELQLYAEINGVPNKQNPNRLYYIRDYKARAKGLFIDRVVREEVKPEPESSEEVTVEETATTAGSIGIEVISASFDDVIDKIEYSIGLMESKIDEYTTRVNNI